MNKFQVLGLIFSGDMSRIHYFSNKFSKITLFLSILVICSSVIWQNYGFQTNYDEIEIMTKL